MELRQVRQSELSSVHALLVENGWGERIGSEQQFASLVAASQIASVAILENQVVGFVRAITDRQSNGYLSMLVVSSPYRGKGIGRGLVEHAMGSNLGVTWVLRAGREGAAAFFSKLGFEPSSLAMERRRAKRDA